MATFARVVAIYKYQAGSGHDAEGATLLLCEWYEGYAATDQVHRRPAAAQGNAYLHPTLPQYPCLVAYKPDSTDVVKRLTTVDIASPQLKGIRWIVQSGATAHNRRGSDLWWQVKNDGLETHHVYGERQMTGSDEGRGQV